MRTAMALAVMVCALAAGSAGAAVIEEKAEKPVGAATGGVDVPVPKGKIRVQCWQYGQKILDEDNLSVLSLSLAGQANAITFRPAGRNEASASLVTQNLTSCLLKREE